MKSLLAALLFTIQLSGQISFQVLYSEVYIIPSDSVSNVYYTYKIPYNRLVFEKAGENYKASYKISIEITDSINHPVSRQIIEKNFTAKNFDETDSENLYQEGIIDFKLKKGSYFFNPVLTDLNSNREIRLKEFNIKSNDFSEFQFLLLSDVKNFLCENDEVRTAANFDSKIPFSEQNYDLLIPVMEDLSEIKIEIIKAKDTVISETTSAYSFSDFYLRKCENKIVFNNSEKPGIKYFILSNFNKKLLPGNYTINLYKKDENKPFKTFVKEVRWFNKPLALNNLEFSIRMLKFIEKEDVIKNLLKEDDEKYSDIIFNYWKKYDPTPESAFNQLMEEYYQRIDYSAKSFTTITGKNGIETDRGRIFIQFGEPQKIERSSNQDGKIVETWTYIKSGRRFHFVDEKGTGEFVLENG